jgi:hypothetical protein
MMAWSQWPVLCWAWERALRINTPCFSPAYQRLLPVGGLTTVALRTASDHPVHVLDTGKSVS